MWRWDDFLSALLYVSKSDKYPVSLAIKLFSDPGSSSYYGTMFAMATVSILPSILFFSSSRNIWLKELVRLVLKGKFISP